MRRQTIAYEGREVVPNQLLELGSIEWLENVELPVMTNMDGLEQVGYAVALQNEPDGAISAHIVWFDSSKVTYDTSIHCFQATLSEDGNGFRTVHSGYVDYIFCEAEVPWGKTGKLDNKPDVA
jgi:hypothetical protein